MRKYYLLLLLLGLSLSHSFAQFQTAGTNRRYTLAQLAAASGGYVTQVGTGWQINDTIRLAATDTLSITTNETIRLAAAALVYVDGTLLINPPDSVKFTAINTATPWHSFTFSTTGSASRLRKTVIEYCAGVRLISSDIQLFNCEIRRCVPTINGRLIGSGALNASSSSPLIQGCRFVRNARSAIASPANGGASPTIRNCQFLLNNVENGNYPQINLGPGNPAQTILIQNCLVVGNVSTNVGGGIGLSNLLGSGGVTKAEVRGNIIRNNRYGITVTGSNYNTLITRNLIQDNNTNPNAATGGSGINFTGNTQTGVVSRNVISGNLWGVTMVKSGTTTNGMLISFGDATSTDSTNVGRNRLVNNGNGGTIYDFYNNAPDALKAENNDWGTNVAATVEAHIVHNPDNATLGLVDYQPFLTPLAARTAAPLTAALYPNPARNQATLQLPAAGRVHVALRDVAGRLVREADVTATPDGRAVLVLAGLKPGLYVYQAEQNGRLASGRLAVE
ncbi:T9SS type A sorting domain-containing protein [Hymenobacter busanensis]|uniref:T9SS type A sorting domain-containing protein n=1 Tax=Hymenobacter busanensis TaxID=2607656 RepID=A0A7L4ZWX0_9BACT|nr:T9SS type A sorting domain-containing protein [Hymenobacter busanensis]KAA9325276.1 T9SS type A sorting domain-containing protein [Hymenobacter busanensis]QHJ07731.1 T9SS type A sorting domain-containing protein [Hymenobacter busanensis]